MYNSLVRVFQVTIDGAKDNHDKYRTLSNKTGTFDVIYNNLLAIRDMPEKEILVQIRANFLRDTLDSMIDLLNMYCKDFKDDKRFSLCFRPIVDFDKGMKEKVMHRNEARELENYMMCLMEEKGIKVGNINQMFSLLPSPIDAWCRVNEENRYVINYDGKLFCCDACISDDSACIGTINEKGDILLNSTVSKWRYNIFDDYKNHCLKCRRLPICMGGCILERMQTGVMPCHWTD